MHNFIDKIKNSQNIIAEVIEKHPKIAVACSFGKDSITVVNLARQVKPDIAIFSIMTRFKPQTTLSYLVEINHLFNLNVKVFFVGKRVPDILSNYD